MRAFGVTLSFLLAFSDPLLSVIRIEETTAPLPRYCVKYEIVDLGAVDVDPALMNCFAMPVSYAPRLNNLRQVVANRTNEGFVRDAAYGEWTPQVGSTLTGHSYDLNDEGDVIVALSRKMDEKDWFLWGQKKLKKEKRYPVGLPDDILGKNVWLRSVNNQKWAVGYFNPGGDLRPAVWNPCRGFKPLGFYLGWDFKGVAFGISQSGSIVGCTIECGENPPFIWNANCGLEVLHHYRLAFEVQSCHDIQGVVHFADVVVTDDHYVYGTLFWEEDGEKTSHYAYRWEPYQRDFRYLPDLDGIRINAVNSKHTLVGALDGNAYLREQGRKPVLLKNFVDDPNWQLIEATDINDRGDITGYGKYQGVVHVFLLKRV